MAAPPPIGALLLGVIAGASIVLPLLAILLQVPWGSARELLLAPSSLQALGLSLATASLAAIICLLLGLPLALLLARTAWPGRSVVRAVVLVPLVLPPVVSGIALLMLFGRQGLLGPLLAAAEIRIVFTTAAVVIAQVFVSLPFTVLTLESALVSAGTRPEQVAASLGASPRMVLWRITMPRILPALVTGTILAFARALGEFGATLTFAGSMPGITRTLPLEIYLVRETSPDAAAVLSLLLVAVALAVVLVAYLRRADDGGGGAR
ncbi:MAG: ABC transporter permease [Brachybacterium sp.]|nr:ABC transporter permease [Brachybacterium sp.]